MANGMQEIGSFAAVIVPVIGATIWGGKILLNWFTQMIQKQQEQTDRLMTELVAVMRETQSAHQGMTTALGALGTALNESRVQSAQEHAKIVECMKGGSTG